MVAREEVENYLVVSGRRQQQRQRQQQQPQLNDTFLIKRPVAIRPKLPLQLMKKKSSSTTIDSVGHSYYFSKEEDGFHCPSMNIVKPIPIRVDSNTLLSTGSSSSSSSSTSSRYAMPERTDKEERTTDDDSSSTHLLLLVDREGGVKNPILESLDGTDVEEEEEKEDINSNSASFWKESTFVFNAAEQTEMGDCIGQQQKQEESSLLAEEQDLVVPHLLLAELVEAYREGGVKNPILESLDATDDDDEEEKECDSIIRNTTAFWIESSFVGSAMVAEEKTTTGDSGQQQQSNTESLLLLEENHPLFHLVADAEVDREEGVKNPILQALDDDNNEEDSNTSILLESCSVYKAMVEEERNVGNMDHHPKQPETPLLVEDSHCHPVLLGPHLLPTEPPEAEAETEAAAQHPYDFYYYYDITKVSASTNEEEHLLSCCHRHNAINKIIRPLPKRAIPASVIVHHPQDNHFSSFPSDSNMFVNYDNTETNNYHIIDNTIPAMVVSSVDGTTTVSSSSISDFSSMNHNVHVQAHATTKADTVLPQTAASNSNSYCDCIEKLSSRDRILREFISKDDEENHAGRKDDDFDDVVQQYNPNDSKDRDATTKDSARYDNNEGIWFTLTKPTTFFSYRNQNDNGYLDSNNDFGDPLYKLGYILQSDDNASSLSFSTTTTTQDIPIHEYICSVQGNFNEIYSIDVDNNTRKELLELDLVPKSLRKDIQNKDIPLRTYNIITAFTIEPNYVVSSLYPNSPNKNVKQPIRGMMCTYGYMIPDPNILNRFSTWIVKKEMKPNNSITDIHEWKQQFLTTTHTTMESLPAFSLSRLSISPPSHTTSSGSNNLFVGDQIKSCVQNIVHNIFRGGKERNEKSNYVLKKNNSNISLSSITTTNPFINEQNDDDDDDDGNYSIVSTMKRHPPFGGHGIKYIDINCLDNSLRVIRNDQGNTFVSSRVESIKT